MLRAISGEKLQILHDLWMFQEHITRFRIFEITKFMYYQCKDNVVIVIPSNVSFQKLRIQQFFLLFSFHHFTTSVDRCTLCILLSAKSLELHFLTVQICYYVCKWLRRICIGGKVSMALSMGDYLWNPQEVASQWRTSLTLTTQ